MSSKLNKSVKKIEIEHKDESNNEDENNAEELNEEDSDEENDEGDEEEEEEEEEDKESTQDQEKKLKLTVKEMSLRLDELNLKIKDIKKDIKKIDESYKEKEKMRNVYDNEVSKITKILHKTHEDEVKKAVKAKPKRKGNVNGGFNKEQLVPEILCKFLGFENDKQLSRPKVLSALYNKFTELGIRKGVKTIIDKPTALALGLGKEGIGRELMFNNFMSFVVSFYPKKEPVE
jgi:hypothetical protein